MAVKYGLGLLVVLGLAACSAGESPDGGGVQSGGWTTLLDGTSLDGWTQSGTANWRIADGAAHADSGNGFLVTPRNYADFDLELEFFVSADANSGVFIRCASAAEIGAASCYEVNIFDQRPDPTYRTGSIVDVAAPAAQIDTGGQWNTYAISARGPRLLVTLNGQRTVDVEDDRLASGPIALQYGAGTVMFRNVRIRE
jgi:hypothetical protein